jgi:hypothetical protein
MCGGLTQNQVCQSVGINGTFISASVEDCNGMIAATIPTTSSTFQYNCPIGSNGRKNDIIHYVKYGCNGGPGTKYDLNINGVVVDYCACPSSTGCGKNNNCKDIGDGGKFEKLVIAALKFCIHKYDLPFLNHVILCFVR